MFELHPQLAKDCHVLGRMSQCHLLLHRNAAVRWFILVPETSEENYFSLPQNVRNVIDSECAAIAAVIQNEGDFPKINFGCLGNVVPQLHLHVVGRHPSDPCWPEPVWGNLSGDKFYSDQELEQIQHRVAPLLSPNQ